MFSKVEKFRVFPSRRAAPGVIPPANDNRAGARQNGAQHRRSPRLVCRWSEIAGANRLACRWEFENPDEPSLSRDPLPAFAFHKTVVELSYRRRLLARRRATT
jgi:hypothetical protein